MQQVQETNLAWSLIEAAKPELDKRERNHVFISVGAGDSFTAIRILIKLIADKQIPLPDRLVQLCAGWLEAYMLHEDHARLQVLIDGLALTDSNIRSGSGVRSLTCVRGSVAQAICNNANHDGGAVARAG